MKRVLDVLHLADRVALSAIFAGFAVRGLSLLGQPAFANGGLGNPSLVESDAMSLALRVLLAVIAIWLFFGVRTRVVALIGTTLFLAAHILPLGGGIEPGLALGLGCVIALTLPLLAFGGGRFALLSRGWADLV